MGPHEAAVERAIEWNKTVYSLVHEMTKADPTMSAVGSEYHLDVLALENLLPLARQVDKDAETAPSE